MYLINNDNNKTNNLTRAIPMKTSIPMNNLHTNQALENRVGDISTPKKIKISYNTFR